MRRLPARTHGGNTPTGVGKTAYALSVEENSRKHPHGCGEDKNKRKIIYGLTETPPRVWGRPQRCIRETQQDRNTPTGVGKTFPLSRKSSRVRKHPHGCGEDKIKKICFLYILETPPRVWGRQRTYKCPPFPSRNTPTGVGKTRIAIACNTMMQKHPHGCGEDGAACAEVGRR